jgi:integrase
MVEARRTERRDLRLPLHDLYDPAVPDQLWCSLPDDCRIDRITKASVPARYVGAIREQTIDPRGAHWTTIGINFGGLPEPMRRELAWLMFREVELGRFIHPLAWTAMIRTLRAATTAGTTRGRSAVSLLQLSTEEWLREARFAALRGYRYAACDQKPARHRIGQLLDVLIYAYHRGDWWELDVWNPRLDARIPRRDHEPFGSHVANFSRLSPWLRGAAKLWLSHSLATGRYTWSSVKSRLDALKWLQRHIDAETDAGPILVDDEFALRGFVVRFCDRITSHRVERGTRAGQPLGKNPRRQIMTSVEQFYRWCFDNRDDPALLTVDPRWALLKTGHSLLFRPEDKPRMTNLPANNMVLEDAVVSRIADGCDWLAAPAPHGGGDLQAFHALLLLIRLGRRVNEILMMDYDPIEPMLSTSTQDSSGFVARLRYQQTKIESAGPGSIPIDDEVLAIIRAQQQHAQTLMTHFGSPGRKPRYLFLSVTKNRFGTVPYPMATFHMRIVRLSAALGITDSTGKPVEISKTHRFRHTVATSLLNGGVPLHVVMRYLGHVTPAMTLHYAVTHATTMETEFLRYRKISTDGRTPEVDGSDLYDLLQLDQRADRILPNGWCSLPPRRSCDKGNACLTCNRFVTDATHADTLQHQRDETEALIRVRQEAFTARHGVPMADNNIWLEGRTSELRSLDRILLKITPI